MLSKRRDATNPQVELTPADAASYIADMLSGMRDVARRHELVSLAQLLDIACAEALSVSRGKDVHPRKISSPSH